MFSVIEKTFPKTGNKQEDHPWLAGQTVYFVKNERNGEVGFGGYTTRELAEEIATRKLLIELVQGQPILAARQKVEDSGYIFGISVCDGKKLPARDINVNRRRLNFHVWDGLVSNLDYIG